MRHISVSPVRTGLRYFLVILVVFVLSLQGIFAQTANKQQVKRQKAAWNMKIAKEQMSRKLYREAEVNLSATISECGSYVTAVTSERLDKMLMKARSSQKATQQIVKQPQQRDLFGDSPNEPAKQAFGSARDSEFLVDVDRIPVITPIEGGDNSSVPHNKQIEILFENSAKPYNDAGRLDHARVDFGEVSRLDDLNRFKVTNFPQGNNVKMAEMAGSSASANPWQIASNVKSPGVSDENKLADILSQMQGGQPAAKIDRMEPVSQPPAINVSHVKSSAGVSDADQLAEILSRMEGGQPAVKTNQTKPASQPRIDFPLSNQSRPKTVAVNSNMSSLAQQYEALKMQVYNLFEQSVGYYNAGDLEAARVGFEEVALSGIDATINGLSAAGYLDLIEKSYGLRQEGLDTIDVAIEQYRQGMFSQSKNSLQEVKDTYSAYLNAEDNQRLELLLAQAGEAVVERERIAGNLIASSQFKAEGKLLEARESLVSVKDSDFLSNQERQQISSAIAEFDNALSGAGTDSTPVQGDVVYIFANSIELFNAGKLSESRDGFIQVANSGLNINNEGFTAEDYLASIDQSLVRETIAPPIALQSDLQSDLSPNQQESSYIRQVQAQRNRVKGYVEAVVTNASATAAAAFGKNDFATAISELSPAFSAIKTHQMILGAEKYQAYKTQLESIKEQIEAGARKFAEEERVKTEAQSKILADELKGEVRQQREQAIANYFDGADAFESEHKYEDALGQIERVLLVDPSNREALSRRIRLKDTIRWRSILDEEHATNEEELRLLTTVVEKDRPYSNEITYPGAYDIESPRNWKDITERRKKDEWEGRNPADEKIYQQLEQLVDMSQFTDDMPFYEAIDLLRNSVEPPLPLTVMWKDLSENAFIEKEEPIGISFGESVVSVPLKTGLDQLLKAVSGGLAEIDYAVKEGMVSIATKESLPDNLIMETYDVAQLVSEQMGMMGGMGGGRGGGMSGGMSGGGMMGGMGGGMMGGGMMGGGMMGGGGGGGYGGGGGGYGGGGGGGYGGGGGGGYGGGGGGQGGYGGGGQGGQGGYGGGGGGSSYRLYELISVIVEIDHDTWSEDTIDNYGNNNNRGGSTSRTSTTSTIDGEMLGKGRIKQFGPTRLIVWQTAEVHEQIRDLIEQMSDLSDNQISIETRFIVVDEHFLEDIGIQTTITRLKIGSFGGISDDTIAVDQSSRQFAQPTNTGVPGSIGSVGTTTPALDFGISYGGPLDDLAVTFLIQATNAHANARTLTAPKLTVISGESANISVMTQRDYISNASVAASGDVGTVSGGTLIGSRSYIEHEISSIGSGIQMMIVPTITADKKYVILSINTSLSDVRFASGLTDTTVAFIDGEPINMNFEVPESQETQITTRIIVPDKGTVLLGGLTLSALQEREMGVPVLSKIPVLGRLFSNRSEVKDKQVLLVLVKPTIILKDEAEADAIAAISVEIPRY